MRSCRCASRHALTLVGHDGRKPDDQVSVAGRPARDGGKRLGGHKLMLSDGRAIMLRPATNLPVGHE